MYVCMYVCMYSHKYTYCAVRYLTVINLIKTLLRIITWHQISTKTSKSTGATSTLSGRCEPIEKFDI